MMSLIDLMSLVDLMLATVISASDVEWQDERERPLSQRTTGSVLDMASSRRCPRPKGVQEGDDLSL